MAIFLEDVCIIVLLERIEIQRSGPGTFAGAHSSEFEMLYFAAALFASRITDRSSASWRIEAAQSWLWQSLPRWIFSQRAEALILEFQGTYVAAVFA